MKIIERKSVGPYHVLPGDTFNVWHEQTLLTSTPITQTQIIDTVVVFEIKPGEFGLEARIGAVVGKSGKA